MPDDQKKKKKKKLYEDSQVVSALEAVKSGLSFRAAAAQHDIPYTTLRDRFYRKYTEGKHQPGPSFGLSEEQEQRLKNHLLHMTKIGYGITKKDIPCLVQEILNCAEEEDPEQYNVENRRFKDNTPSLTWVYRFLKRHPELTSRVPENLGHQRAHISEVQIRNWFENMKTSLKKEHKLNAQEFFSEANAERIFIFNESGFPLAGTTGKLKIITGRRIKNVDKLAQDSEEQVTVLGCVSAAGDFSKPLVIFPGKRTPKYNMDNVNPEDYDVGVSPNGWISTDIFFRWLTNLFYESIKNKVKFPVMLLMDSHVSHINLAVSRFCQENNIILYCFPPHAGHVVQPLDVSVYGPLKKYWNSALNEFTNQDHGLAVTRTHFFNVFNTAWKTCIQNKQNVVSCFRKCGLVPFNPGAVAFDRLLDQTGTHAPEKTYVDVMEKVGMTRVFQLFESYLTNELKDLFSSRYANGYNIVNETDRGIMYQFYKSTRDLIETCQDSNDSYLSITNANQSHATSAADELMNNGTNHNESMTEPTTPPHTKPSTYVSNISQPSPIPTFVSASQASSPQHLPLHSTSSTSASMSHDITSESIEIGTDPLTSRPISTRKYSPFKQHLRISDNLFVTRKFPRSKCKVPPAISGSVCVQMAQMQQDEKKKKIEQQGERKRKKLEKKENTFVKGSARKKRRKDSSSENDDENQEVVYDDCAEEFAFDDENACFACLGKEHLNDHNAWIGCSNDDCNRWFHKTCIAEDVTNMSEKQLKALKFYCKVCQRKCNKQ